MDKRRQISSSSNIRKNTKDLSPLPSKTLDLSGLSLTQVPFSLLSSVIRNSLDHRSLRGRASKSVQDQSPRIFHEAGSLFLQNGRSVKLPDASNQRRKRKSRKERGRQKFQVGTLDSGFSGTCKTGHTSDLSYLECEERLTRLSGFRKTHNEKVGRELSVRQKVLEDIKAHKCRNINDNNENPTDAENHRLKKVDSIVKNTKSKRLTNLDDDRKSVWKALTAELEVKLRERNGIKVETDAKFASVKELSKEKLQKVAEPGFSVKRSDKRILSNSVEIPPAPPLPTFLLTRFKSSPLVQGSNGLPSFLSFSGVKDCKSDCSSIQDDRSLPSLTRDPDIAQASGLTSDASTIYPVRSRNSYAHKSFSSHRAFSATESTGVTKSIRESDETSEGRSSKNERTSVFQKDFKYFSLPPFSLAARTKKRLAKNHSTIDQESAESASEINGIRSAELLTTKSLTSLQEVQLFHNQLVEFPRSLFVLPYLISINLSWNQIKHLPENISVFKNLELLNLSHNELSEAQLSSLKKLKFLDLASNVLSKLPKLDEEQRSIKFLELTDNEIWNLCSASEETDTGFKVAPMEGRRDDQSAADELEPVTLRLRRNRLTGAVTLASLQHVTELDVSDNGITSLEITSLSSLTSLSCSNNAIVTLSLHGATLQSLIADNNRITRVHVKNHPRQLQLLSIAKNCLGSVPPWLVSCGEIRRLDVSSNNLTSLPTYVTSGHLTRLKFLSVSSNHLEALSTSEEIPEDSLTVAERQRRSNLEVLIIHHNKIEKLMPSFFTNFPKLRVLNISSNKLQELPRTSSPISFELSPYLQEFYAGNNQLRDLSALEICQSLRILSVPYNRITSFSDSFCRSCELLEEIVLSGNCITTLPPGISRLCRLSVFRVHLNPIKSLPRLSHLTSLKTVDASHCQLGRLEFESVVSPSLSTLDIAGNPSLAVDRQQFAKCRSRRSLNMVNTATDKGRRFLPFQDDLSSNEEALQNSDYSDEAPSSPDTMDNENDDPFTRSGSRNIHSPKYPWSIGFCESTGIDMELTLEQLRVPDLDNHGTIGLVAMADGGSSTEAANRLFTLFPEALKEEKLSCPDIAEALKYSLLSCLRQIVVDEGNLPLAFCCAYLEAENKRMCDFDSRRSVRTMKTEGQQCSSLRLCYFGEIKAVVTDADGPPLIVSSSSNSKQQVMNLNTSEVPNSELSSSLPDPHTTLVRLGPHHKSLVIASSSLWESIDPDEVNELCRNISDPAIAAKRLLTLAQSYGSKKPLSVLMTVFPCASLRNTYHYSSLSSKVGSHHDDKPQKSQKNNEKCHEPQKRKPFPFVVSKMNSQEDEDRYRYPPSGQSDTEDAEHCKQSYNDFGSGQNIINQLSQKTCKSYHYSPQSDFNCTCDSPKVSDIPSSSASVSTSQDCAYDLLSPPAGFGDSDSDNDNDSGFSGNSDGKLNKSHTTHDDSSINQVFKDQFRSWDYLLAQNTKALFLRELHRIQGQEKSPITSVSTPNLSALPPDDKADATPSEKPVTSSTCRVPHFQRNVLRKSRFARGALKLLQHKLNNTLKLTESIQKFRCSSYSDSLKRYGSLQNLKHYESCKPWSRSLVNVSHPMEDRDLNMEMKEHNPVEAEELESRMQHYWNTGVTCF